MASIGYTPGLLCSPAMIIRSLNQRGWLLLPLCRWQEVQGSSLPWGLAWSNRTMAPPHNSGGFRWFPPCPTCVGWYTATTGCAALDGWLCPLSFNFFNCRVGGLLQHLHPGALKEFLDFIYSKKSSILNCTISLCTHKERKMLSIDGNSPKTSKFREVKFLFLKSAPIIDKMC